MTMGFKDRLIMVLLPLALGLRIFMPPQAAAVDPVALSTVPVPEPTNLGRFVTDRNAAIRLGKALFWDMQVGSDGKMACASCHFNAGTDGRTRNTLHPGADGVLDNGGRTNDDLLAEAFPFVQFGVPDDENSGRVVNSNDRTGGQGVNRSNALGLIEGRAKEPGRSQPDGTFNRNGRNTRQVSGRNPPSIINAVFNFANNWDGRANHFFNGVNPLGVMDQEAVVYINIGGAPSPVSLVDDLLNNEFALDNASVASQTTGPPLSTGEMSWIGRSWPELGRKMLSLEPLAGQEVHPQDSRLAVLRNPGGTGLNSTYSQMIQDSFHPDFWSATAPINGFSQLEQNFPLFFGLAIQLYNATLVADQTPFDRFLQGDVTALSQSAQRGWGTFQSGGAGCLNCHVGPELSGASITLARADNEAGLLELMSMADGNLANYDIGFYNIGVTPTSDDPGRGGRVNVNGQSLPISFTGQWFERAEMPFTPLAQPGCINDFLVDPPTICPPQEDTITREADNGAFKTPGLRNVELTGPYMHNGSMLTLMQVVDFYTRGGNFSAENIADLDPFINPIGTLQGEAERRELVDFLLSLTDERVRWERAPFDHPQLFVPNGHLDRISGNPKRERTLVDNMIEIPAVGASGRKEPLKPILAPASMNSAEFHYQR